MIVSRRWLARTAVLIGALAVSGTGTVQVSANGSDRLTLAQAVKEALVHNERVAGQHDNNEQAALAVRLAKNAFQPKIVPNINGSFGQSNVSNQTYRVDLTQRLASGGEVQLGLGTSTSQIPADVPGQPDIRFYNSDTTLAVRQPLLRGFGPTIARRSLASAEMRQTDAARQQALTDQQVALDVASAYYRLVAQQGLVDVAKQGLDRSRKLRDASEAKLDAGMVSQLDVLRAQSLVSEAEIQLFDAEAAVEDARDQLCFLTGREPGVLFDVVAEIPRVAESPGGDDAVALALKNRLDLQSAIATAADADRAISFAHNQLLPQFDVNLALTRRKTVNGFLDSFGTKGYQFATFFTIAMPVDRTPEIVAYQTALINRDRGQRDIETLRKRIVDEVQRAARERDRIMRTLAAAEAGVDIARKEVDVAQFRYDRGLSNNLDVVNAQASLLNAESRRISALAQLAVARLNVLAISGTFDPRRDIVETPAVAVALKRVP